MRKSSIIVLAVVGLIAGGLFNVWYHPSASDNEPPLFQLPDTTGKLRHNNEWSNKLLVINHWATWCPPCREEIPLLIDLQQQYSDKGLQIIGIAHDNLQAARRYGDEVGINYPSLVALTGGRELLQQHGSQLAGSLPFTAIYDQNGVQISTRLGAYKGDELARIVVPLLDK